MICYPPKALATPCIVISRYRAGICDENPHTMAQIAGPGES
jgi:hypothetical protein